VKRLLFVLLAACGGDVNPPVADAPDNAPACTGAVYDNCNVNADCDSANCKLFEGDGFQVCTQACDASNPCPNDGDGTPGSCNNKGICKPAQHTVCKP
jgi:hypothetical protein